MQAANRQTLTAALTVGMSLVAAGIAWLSFVVMQPMLTPPVEKKAPEVKLPNYDVSAWHGLLVQHRGRTKPFESAAIETLRHITGREKFQGKDPVAVVLMWALLKGNNAGTKFMDWENYPFILCEYQPLREAIFVDLLFKELDSKDNGYLLPADCKGAVKEHFADLDADGNGKLTRDELQQGRHLIVKDLTEAQRYGQFASPSDLRNSLTMQGFLRQMEDPENAPESADKDLRKKGEEVAGRLIAYDSVSQNQWATLSLRRKGPSSDPFHAIALDKVPRGALFSMGDLENCQRDYNPKTEDSESWRYILVERVRATPQLYVKPEQQQALEQFQQRIKGGTADRSIDELEKELATRRTRLDEELDALAEQESEAGLMAKIRTIASTKEEQASLGRLFHKSEDRQDHKALLVKIAWALKQFQRDRDEKALADLRRRAGQAQRSNYNPDDNRWRMLHLGYLETRYPSLYRDSLAWQKYPLKDIRTILARYTQVKEAYAANQPARFKEASESFFALLKALGDESGKYKSYPRTEERTFLFWTFEIPVADLLAYEMTLNEVAPFQKAWIIMVLSVVLFVASMLLPRGLPSNLSYLLAFVTYLGALSFQVYGFFLRIMISDRPPVSNLYETLIWVAFMSAIFALILELVYRKRIIGLAGAVVATLGLLMADQLSLTFDPAISPLQPVLRTKYWLMVHVLTIVSSYAAGTLAWGLGNLSLGIIAFGTARKQTVKTLANFTYRAIQIAVLLLAFGTFLGGMWAAESWGRFWGWDPKEVWALIALVCYVIPLHMRYVGWVKDFGLAISAVVCYGAIVMSWYLFSALGGGGLHSYALAGSGPGWVFLGGLVNLEWVLLTTFLYVRKTASTELGPAEGPTEMDL
jgi:ABC-type transport system involved in cytochrome c biogenesis permease subunit